MHKRHRSASRRGAWIALALIAFASAGCRSYHGYKPETLSPPGHGDVPDTNRPDTAPPPGYPGSR